MIRFFIPGKPIPQGSKRWVGRMIEANADLKPWRATVTAYTRKAMLAHRVAMIDEPVHMTAMFYLKRPKHHYGTGRNAGILKPHAPKFVFTTPDLDKLQRAVQDGITDAGLWRDDCLVVQMIAGKRYAEQPGVNVWIAKISELGQGADHAEANNLVAGQVHDAELQLDI